MDLQSALSALRRRRLTLLVAALVGSLVGIGSVLLWPPMYVSSSLVLLPGSTADAGQVGDLVKTEARIAMSDPVLGRAAKRLTPKMPLKDLKESVEVSPATQRILEIQGQASDPKRAEELSSAVANAYVVYVSESATSVTTLRRTQMTAREKELRASLQQVEAQIQNTTARLRDESPQTRQGKADARALAELTAQQGSLVLQINAVQGLAEATQPGGGASLLQSPSPAERAGLVSRYLAAVLVGMLIGLLAAAGVTSLLARRDHRLRFRDDIADAVGSPVVASVHTRAPRSVADWIFLLRDHAPGAVEAWAWRQALRRLGSVETAADRGNPRGKGKRNNPRSIAVITMSADRQALATGPMLAAYAASASIRTHLVPAQRDETAAMLWAACASLEDQGARPGLSVGPARASTKADLTVLVAVLDRQEPVMLNLPTGCVIVLAVSAGHATAEELARLTVKIDDAGGRIQGIVVTDPDSLDRTTGRRLQPDRMQQMPLPTRLTGAPTPRSPRNTAPTADGSQG
jgi:capsular polysaccharide biosynthesis protein